MDSGRIRCGLDLHGRCVFACTARCSGEPMAMRGRVHMPRCAIAGVEATVAETAHSFPRHSHDRFGVGVIVAGGHRSSSGRGVVEARANDAIMVNPGEVHDGSPLDERGRAWRMLYFEPPMLADAADRVEWRGCARDRTDATGGTRSVAEGALRAPVHGIGGSAIRAGRLDPRGDDARVARVSTSDSRDDAHTSAVGTDLESDCASEGQDRRRSFITAYADRPCYRGRHEPLPVAAGLCAGDGITTARIQDAAPGDACETTDRTRHDIGRRGSRSGFADQSHMTRAFVRLMGMTPANYAAAKRR